MRLILRESEHKKESNSSAHFQTNCPVEDRPDLNQNASKA